MSFRKPVTLLTLWFLSGLLLPIPAYGAVVRIKTTTAGATGVEAYVALVAPDASTNDPTAEAVTNEGAAEFDVPPGRYEVIVAAPGWGANAMTVFAGDRTPQSVDIELTPHGTTAGVLETEKGLPVTSARIRWAAAAITPAIGLLSDLAMRHLGDDQSSKTDENGWWSLTVPSDRMVPLLIEAPGYEPIWVLHRPTEEASANRLVLRLGSSLEITTGDGVSGVLFTLVPSEPTEVVAPDWQRAIWTRQADNQSAVWEALPPGTYRVEAHCADPLRFCVATEIGSVTVAKGERKKVRLEVPTFPARSSANAMFRLPRRIEHGEVEAFAQTSSGSVARAKHAARRTLEGVLVYVNTHAPSSDAYLLSRTHIVAAGPADGSASTSRSVELVRAEALFRITAPEHSDRPPGGRAEFRNCTHQTLVSIPFGVEDSGDVALPWPTECRSALLRFKGFAPVAIATSLRPAESKQIGVFPLSAAASIEVRAVRSPDLTPAARAVVRVMSLREPADIVFAERTASDDGTVIIDDLPAEEDLTVEARDAESALSGSARVRLEAGTRTRIDPLEIPLPASLTVVPRFTSPFRDAFPDSRVLAIHIRRTAEDEASKTLRQNLRDEDRVHFDSIAPGLWSLVAVVDVGGLGQPLELESVELAAGQHREVDVTVEPDVFRGRLLSRGRGVAANVSVADPPGPGRIRRRFRTKPDGTFTIVLPQAGLYEVDVRFRQEHPAIDLGEVAFDDPLREIQLRVPDAEVEIHARVGEGPAIGAKVTARQLRNRGGGGVFELTAAAPGQTDADGKASLKLAEGKWLIEVNHAEANRRGERLVAVGASGTETVVIPLEEKAVVDGVIRDPIGGAAAGARVNCLFLIAAHTPHSATALTDQDGRFSIDLPSALRDRVRCSATSGAGGVAVFTATAGGSVDVLLPPVSGSLVIEDWPARLASGAYWLMTPDGQIVDLSAVAGHLGKNWTVLAVPRLAAGTWRLIRADDTSAWVMVLRGLGTAMPAITEFSLGQGEIKRIRLQDDVTHETSERQ